MYCVECGKQNDADSRFCVYCGARMEEDSPTRPPSKKGISMRAGIIAAILTIIVIALIAAIVVFAITNDKPDGDTPKATSSSQATPKSTSSTTSNGSSSNARISSWSSTTEDGTLHVKANVNDYTWAELAEISESISRAKSESEALETAKRYNLCNAQGHLDNTHAKSVTLSDGSTVNAQIIDFNHDTTSSGEKAGITFMLQDCVAIRPMNSDAKQTGGWGSCEARSWLNSEFITQLPSELANEIKAANKSTNNVGVTSESSSCVSTTSDKLWLPSAIEIGGTISWASGKMAYSNDIYNAEGTQYKLFRDNLVSIYYENTILARNYDTGSVVAPSSWWTRTTRPRNGQFVYVAPDGNLHNYGNANGTFGIIPCFCL